MIEDCYIACTYFDLALSKNMNLNIPQHIWGNFTSLEDAVSYVKMIRKRKFDTLFGAWDIYYEKYDETPGWHLNQIVKHFPPRKDHDFYGKPIKSIVIAV